MQTERRRLVVGLAALAVVLVVVIAASVVVVSHLYPAPVPRSVAQARDFSNSYSPAYGDDSRQPLSLEPFSHEELTHSLNTALSLDGQEVLFVVAQYPSTEAAEQMHHAYQEAKESGIQYKRLEYHLMSKGYWTATSRIGTFVSWQNGPWLVIIQGTERSAVKRLEKEFKDYLVQ